MYPHKTLFAVNYFLKAYRKATGVTKLVFIGNETAKMGNEILYYCKTPYSHIV
jgi:hypothetical protein